MIYLPTVSPALQILSGGKGRKPKKRRLGQLLKREEQSLEPEWPKQRGFFLGGGEGGTFKGSEISLICLVDLLGKSLKKAPQ